MESLQKKTSIFYKINRRSSVGRSQQRKGRSGEREIVQILRDHGYPVTAGEPMAFGSCPDISGLPGIHCEVKRVEKLNIYSAISQAVEDSQKFSDGLPAVFHRKNRHGWLITMRLEDWLKIYEQTTLD